MLERWANIGCENATVGKNGLGMIVSGSQVQPTIKVEWKTFLNKKGPSSSHHCFDNIHQTPIFDRGPK